MILLLSICYPYCVALSRNSALINAWAYVYVYSQTERTLLSPLYNWSRRHCQTNDVLHYLMPSRPGRAVECEILNTAHYFWSYLDCSVNHLVSYSVNYNWIRSVTHVRWYYGFFRKFCNCFFFKSHTCIALRNN